MPIGFPYLLYFVYKWLQRSRRTVPDLPTRLLLFVAGLVILALLCAFFSSFLGYGLN